MQVKSKILIGGKNKIKNALYSLIQECIHSSFQIFNERLFTFGVECWKQVIRCHNVVCVQVNVVVQTLPVDLDSIHNVLESCVLNIFFCFREFFHTELVANAHAQTQREYHVDVHSLGQVVGDDFGVAVVFGLKVYSEFSKRDQEQLLESVNIIVAVRLEELDTKIVVGAGTVQIQSQRE
jgi:hypothetical protein